MWGVCLDSNAIQDGLFQTVIQYKRKENGEVVIISPKTTYKLDIKHVKELSAPPQYIYGECVSPCNHPDMIGIVCDIAWHFKLNCYFYIIKDNTESQTKNNQCKPTRSRIVSWMNFTPTIFNFFFKIEA